MENLLQPSLPPYVLALFEGETDPAVTADPATDPAPVTPAAPTTVATKPAAAKPAAPARPAAARATPEPEEDPEPRGTRDPATGRFLATSDDPAELKKQLDAANRVIEAQVKRRAEIREQERQKVITDIDRVERTVQLANQRALKGEVRSALREAEAIDSDVAELFLKFAGGNIKIDEDSGDVVGVTEQLEKFKAAKPAFFKAKPADPKGDETKPDDKGGETKPGDKKPDDAKPNATAEGNSPSGTGGGTGKGNFGGLADLRNLTPAERRAAMVDYRKIQRGTRGR